jgi:hypothetical protein
LKRGQPSRQGSGGPPGQKSRPPRDPPFFSPARGAAPVYPPVRFSLSFLTTRYAYRAPSVMRNGRRAPPPRAFAPCSPSRVRQPSSQLDSDLLVRGPNAPPRDGGSKWGFIRGGTAWCSDVFPKPEPSTNNSEEALARTTRIEGGACLLSDFQLVEGSKTDVGRTMRHL